MIAAWEREVIEFGGQLIAGGGRKERLIETLGGYKDGRRPDIIFINSSGEMIYGNVGKTLADGITPITREQRAIKDLIKITQGADVPKDV
jgi:hypothetical protein